MGIKYTTTPISGFNASPPADDGTQSEANKVKWDTIKTKLDDPIKDQVANIDAKLVTSADVGPDAKTANYTTVAGDHQKTIEVTAASVTITLLAIASAPTGYTATVKNSSGTTTTVDATGSETIDGSAATIMLADNEALVVQLNQAETGYIILQEPASITVSDDQVYKGTAAGTADALTVTLTPTLSTLADGTVCFVRALLANATATPTINMDGLGAKTITKNGSNALLAGDIYGLDNEIILRYNATNSEWELLNPSNDRLFVSPNHISGLTLSNDTDTDHDINITSGQATDSSNVQTITLSSEMTKQIDATWAAGDDAGGLFSGSVAVDTWYHVFLIKKDSDGSVDAGFDTSVTAANIPSGYTAYRRLGSVLTDASSNILEFSQFGNEFLWKTTKADMSVSSMATTGTLYTLSVPLGVQVKAHILGSLQSTSTTIGSVYLSSPDVDHQVASWQGRTQSGVSRQDNNYTQNNGFSDIIRTNTSSEIRAASEIASGLSTVYVHTTGWEDPRGQL